MDSILVLISEDAKTNYSKTHKTMKIKIIIFAALLFGFSATTIAQTNTPVVTQSQVKQQKRIKQGVKKGEVTKGEYVAIQKQQRHINRSKKVAKSDGVVTRRERAILNRKQTKASGNIHRIKHNKKDRN